MPRDPIPDGLDVLLVQDSPPEIELTLRPLRELMPDGRIGVARDGEEALDYLLARGAYRRRLGSPPPRLTLLDLRLPKVDGFEVLRAVRNNPRTSTAAVVVLTSSSDPRELAQCYQLGANSCVQKPVEFQAFRQTIRMLGQYWLHVNQPMRGTVVSSLGSAG